MKDPERLARGPATELTQLLLDAGAEEQPSAQARRRLAGVIAAAAGAGALGTSTTAAATSHVLELAARNVASGLSGSVPATTAGSATPAGAKLGWLVLTKWLGIGALGGVVAWPVVQKLSPSEHAPPERNRTVAASAAPRPVPFQTRGPSAPGIASSRQENALAPEPGGEPHPSRKLPPSPVPVPTTERAAPVEHVLLAAEVRFVEQGRAAFQRNAFQETLALLTPYEERFPKRQLLTEVLFLRMEAYSHSGDAGRARSLAALVLSREITGAQAVRAREVLRR